MTSILTRLRSWIGGGSNRDDGTGATVVGDGSQTAVVPSDFSTLSTRELVSRSDEIMTAIRSSRHRTMSEQKRDVNVQIRLLTELKVREREQKRRSQRDD